jgi:hypothetical protein
VVNSEQTAALKRRYPAKKTGAVDVAVEQFAVALAAA